MKAALLTAPLKMEIQEQELPVPGEGQVRIKVAAAGICGTDIDAYKGHQPKGWTITYPFQMGHELSGVVDAVGSGVTEFKVGDRVVPDGRLPCGHCSQCRAGHVNACTGGGYTSGGFKEYSVYPMGSLCRVPDGLSFEEAAFAEPLSCVLYGNNKLNIKVGDFAVVIGDGAIGILHAQVLKSRGAQVALVGLVPERLAIAKEVGIDYIIDSNKEDAVQKVMELTDGKGANEVVSAAGVQSVLQQALSMAARYGQVLYFAATLKDQITLDTDLIHYKELSLIGSYDSTTAFYEQALRALSMGAVKVGPLLTHRFPLDKAQEAMEAARTMAGLKVMFTYDI